MSKECKVKFVKDLKVPYKIKRIELDQVKGKYDRKQKKKTEREYVKEWEEER